MKILNIISHNQKVGLTIINIIVAFLLKFQHFYKISDNAIVILLRFFRYLLFTIGKVFQVQVLQELNITMTIHGCHSLAGISHNPYKKFAICPACQMPFESDIQKLLEGTGRNRRSVKCDYVNFPQHPQEQFRRPCGTVLLNKIKRCGDRLSYKPRKVYCYYGIKAALSNLLHNPDFLTLCNS